MFNSGLGRVILILGCVTISVASTLNAQDGVVLGFSPTNQSEVLIKWYDNDFLDGSYNLYRRSGNGSEWLKLNRSPIRRSSSISQEVINQDPELRDFVDLVNQISGDELEEDLILFTVLLKTFQSNDFADFLGVFYQDSDVVMGEEYEYKIMRITNGEEVILGQSSRLLVGGAEGNEKISGVQINQQAARVHINWLPEEDRFYGVNVYRSTKIDSIKVKLNNNPIVLSQTDKEGPLAYPDPMYLDDSLVQNTSYLYEVRGVGFFENETNAEPIEVFFRDAVAPLPPFGLQGKADTLRVRLKWESEFEPDLQGYYVYRSTLSAGPFQRLNDHPLPVEKGGYLDLLDRPGPYYYYIASVDESGNEGNSDPIFIEAQDVIPPDTPEGLTIKADTGRFHLSWNANSEPDLAGYHIYRTIDSDNLTHYVLLNAEPQKDTFYTQTMPKNVKNTVFYKIVASDTLLNRSAYSASVNAVLPDVVAPYRPQIYKVYVRDQNVVIEWTPNVEEDLFGYHILRSDLSDSISYQRVNINPISIQSRRYLDRTVQPGMAYSYVLKAFDSIGNVSEPSVPHQVRLKPQNLEDIPEELKLKHNRRRQHNLITWNYSTHAGLLGFVIYRGIDRGQMKPLTGVLEDQHFTDKDVTDTVGYYYQVRSYDQNGSVDQSEIIEWNTKN